MRLLGESHALMQSLFAADECHYMSADALTADHITFYVARDRERATGTAGLADMGDYGELKSMFVTPEARGTGVAVALLRRIEDRARALGLPVLRLETGDKLLAAQAFYRREGFAWCGPFGEYRQTGASVFMAKTLTNRG